MNFKQVQEHTQALRDIEILKAEVILLRQALNAKPNPKRTRKAKPAIEGEE